jgi:hypothetical protein
MKAVPTAKKYFDNNVGVEGMYDMLINFAKLHVEAQREAIKEENNKHEMYNDDIDNCYPLTNIK